MYGLTPNYLSDLLPPLVHETTTYNLRNSNHIQTVHANTNLFFNSFIPSTIRAWNSLSDDVKSAPSVASFKFRLNRDLKKPPRYYNIGTRIGQILHARLRMECSALNAHLYRKNIVPSPSCLCGGFESPYHFLFVCPKYTVARPNNLTNYTTQDLLFIKTVNQFLKMKDSFYRCKTLLLNQEGSWIPLAKDLVLVQNYVTSAII